MKRTNLLLGIIYVIVAILSFCAAIYFDGRKMAGIFYGFTGGFGAPGIMMIYRYFYWNRPENKQKYREKLENEAIEQGDEMKEMLRDKSGRYAYLAGLMIVAASIFIYSILGVLGVMNTEHIVIYLACYVLLQVLIGYWIFHYLLKKYS